MTQRSAAEAAETDFSPFCLIDYTLDARIQERADLRLVLLSTRRLFESISDSAIAAAGGTGTTAGAALQVGKM